MKIDEEMLQNAIVRINELQNEIREQCRQTEGAQEYVQEQLKCYREYVKLRQTKKQTLELRESNKE